MGIHTSSTGSRLGRLVCPEPFCPGLPPPYCTGLPCPGLPCPGLPCPGLPCPGLPCPWFSLCCLTHFYLTSLSIVDLICEISFFTVRCSPLILSFGGKVSEFAGTSNPASITPFRAAAIL